MTDEENSHFDPFPPTGREGMGHLPTGEQGTYQYGRGAQYNTANKFVKSKPLKSTSKRLTIG